MIVNGHKNSIYLQIRWICIKMINIQDFKKLFKYLDVIIGFIGLTLGLLIILLSYFGVINQILIGIVIILSILSYFLFRSKLNKIPKNSFNGTNNQWIILNILIILLVILTSILWYSQQYIRPISYFIIICIILGIISIEICIFGDNKYKMWTILLQILFLSIIFRYALYYNFPSIMGYDAYFHTNLANLISITGTIPPIEITHQYLNYPILHLFISFTQILTNCNIKDSVFCSIGIISIILTLCIFIFVNKIAGPKIGLLSVLLINFTNYLIVRGIANITAGSLVICYFILLLLLIELKRKNDYHCSFLILLITITIILTHQLTTFVVLLTLFIIFLSECVFIYFNSSKPMPRNLIYLFIFAITMFSYWMHTAYSTSGRPFFESVLEPFIHVVNTGGQYGSDALVVGHQYSRPFIETFLLQSSYLILPFFAIGGILFWISKNDMTKFSIALTAGTLYVISYSLPLLGIRNLLTDRWMPLLSILLVILAATYIISIIDVTNIKWIQLCSIFTIVFLFSFFMITTPGINKDNPLVAKETTVRNQFMQNEISASVLIGSHHDGKVIVDSTYLGAFRFYGYDHTIEGYIELEEWLRPFARETNLIDTSNEDNTLILLRRCTLTEPISQKVSTLYGDTIAKPLSNATFDYFEGPNYNMIYTNNNVQGYQST